MKKTSKATGSQGWLLPTLIVAIILTIIYSALRDNFHVVVKDQVYRSAQLSATTTRVLVRLKHIKTIINLRGENPQSRWYRQEVDLSNHLGLQHYDIALRSTNLPSTEQLQQLAQLIQQAPKPLLIHCLSGSDRSGLASAMAKILLENAPLKEAKKQFSWRYYVLSKQSVGKQVFASYQKWLNEQHASSNLDHFVQWVYNKPFDH